MLTAIRGDQIKGNQIADYHVADSSNAYFNGGVHHSKLNLDNSIVASFLNTDESVHRAVLDSHLIALWDVAMAQSVSGTSIDVTTIINTTATSSEYQGVNADGSSETGNPKAIIGPTEKGVLLTGTGSGGTGIQNYRAQIRDASSKDPIHDDLGGRVYGELTSSAVNSTSGSYTLSFKKSDASAFSMSQVEILEITTTGDEIRELPSTTGPDGKGSGVFYHSLHNKYFQVSSPSADYYVWYAVSGQTANDPAGQNPGRIGLRVDIASEATASAVALATQAAISGDANLGGAAGFTPSVVGNVLTLTNNSAGVPISEAKDGLGTAETDFAFTVTQAGSPTQVDFMFLEVFSYLTAPVLSFTNGVGFADIVGVAGSHNHHDLYYTKLELDAGQLDSKYYTKSLLDSGQLDFRYYTEGELDPNPGSDTGEGKLDTRYYTQSRISSSNTPSGASLVGVSSITNLSANTVQGALAELQGDVDDILSGAANINHSLDRAYEDGSVVTVDSRSGNVDFQLEDTYSFVISDSAGVTPIFTTTANAAGDSIDIAADLGVTGDTTLTGVVSQSGGAVTINAGNAVDVDGTNVTIDGTAASSVRTTAANLTVGTVTSGTLTVSSAGQLLMKDQHLGTALPLADASNTTLSSVLTADGVTSIVGAINENADDLNTLITVTLPSTVNGSAGADQIGATGITGVIPTGGSLGASGSVQAMLEGIAKGSAGGKVFPTISGSAATGDPTSPGGFTEEKTGGMYFKPNEIVFIKDEYRFVMVLTSDTNTTEGTGWVYLWSNLAPMAGPSFNVISDSVTFDSTGAVSVAADAGITLSENSGAQIRLTDAGTVDVDAAAGQPVLVASDTEIELNGGALVDIDGTAITMDGQLTATGAADDNMIIQTTGVGQVQLSAAEEIDLTGGTIDINAGTGRSVTVDSDTSVAINGGALVDIDGTAVDVDATGDVTVGGNNVLLTGATEVDLTAPLLDLNGEVDMDGAAATFTTSGAFTVAATGAVDVDGSQVNVDAAGAHVGLTSAGQVDVDAAAGQIVDITSDTEVQIDGGALVDIDGTAVTIDGATTVTGAADDNFVVNTTGVGSVLLNTESKLDVNAPSSWFRGDVSVDSGHQINVDKINITSVDPSDFATITGQRTGIPFTGNLLVNPGFESGSGADASDWTEGAFSGRTEIEKYYDNWSYSYVQSSEPGGTASVATQAVTGLGIESHIFSFWFKGNAQSAVQVVLNGSAPVEIVPAGTVNPAWTRYNVDITPVAADGNFVLQVAGSAGHNNHFFVDALQLEVGSGAPTGFFSTMQSELILRIGDEAEDKISFQSQAPSGGTVKELMAIDNTTVRVYGDLIVDGSQTIINSTELTVDDNTITINKNMIGDPDVNMPGGTSEFIVERGDEADTALRWNETTNKWELTNDGLNFFTIVTSSGSDSISMDVAYDGGSAVSVDDTNVNFNLAASKKFIVSDGETANTNKFSVSAGSGLDSIKLNTSGGIDIDATAGVTIDGATVITGATQVIGAMNLDGAIDHDGVSFNSTVTGDFGVDAATATLVASGAASLTASGVSIDSDAASNFTVDGAGLTLATTTSGNIAVSAAGTLDMDAASATLDASTIATTGVLTQTGNTQIIGDLNMDGSVDMDGAAFTVDVTGTGAQSVVVNTVGGIDIDAASTITANATNIQTTGILTQTGATQIIGAMNLDGSIDADGETINIAASGTAGTHLQLSSTDAASITSVGLTLEAGTGAIIAEADAASSFNVTGGNLSLKTTTSGNVALDSAARLTFKDQFVTNALPFSEAGVDTVLDSLIWGYDAQSDFFWTTRLTGNALPASLWGAVNANRYDLWEYVELLATQGADTTVAAGANLIGVDGITGVVPSTSAFLPSNGASAGDPGTLQEILNGLAQSVGGGKTFANEAAFLTAKSSGIYFKNDEHVRILDTNRVIRVLSGQGTTTTVKDVDWTYLYDSTSALGGAEFFVNTTSAISLTSPDVNVSATTFDVVASGGVTIDGESTVTLDAASNLILTSGATIDMNAVTFDVDGTTLDVDMLGAALIDSAAASHFTVAGANLTLSTQTSGNVNITSAADVAVAGALVDIDATTFDVDASGAFTIDGNAASIVRTTGANLNIQTVGSGEINFYDARMPGVMPLTDSTHYDLNDTVNGVRDPDGPAVVSIFDAISRAYHNTGDTSRKTYYEAPALTSTQAALNYVQVSDVAGVANYLSTAHANNGGAAGDEVYDLPSFGANTALTPLQLRRDHGIFLSIYLNGLRLSDSEWVYAYDHATGRKIISFNTNHGSYDPNNDGDNDPLTNPFDLAWVTVNAQDAIALSTQDHIVFDCTFQKYSNV